MTYLTRLQSERLKFRPLVSADAIAWTQFLSNKNSSRFFPTLDLTPNERAKSWVEKQINAYDELNCGHYAILHKKTNEFIGQCGLLTQEINGVTETEIGYHLFEEYTGFGYATEAAQHMKSFAFEVLDTPSVISIIHEDNLASQAVAKRNGMKEDYRTEWKTLQVIVYRVINPHYNL